MGEVLSALSKYEQISLVHGVIMFSPSSKEDKSTYNNF